MLLRKGKLTQSIAQLSSANSSSPRNHPRSVARILPPRGAARSRNGDTTDVAVEPHHRVAIDQEGDVRRGCRRCIGKPERSPAHFWSECLSGQCASASGATLAWSRILTHDDDLRQRQRQGCATEPRLRVSSLRVTIVAARNQSRLANYLPRLLRELTLVLNKFEIHHGIQYHYEQIPEERDAVHKELLIAQYQELGATRQEIVALFKRAGLSWRTPWSVKTHDTFESDAPVRIRNAVP